MKMLKEAILYSEFPEEIRPLLRELEVEELPLKRSSNPEFIISYGGDGTFLTAERDWPEIPKIVLRRSRVCEECKKDVPAKILHHMVSKKFEIKEFPKLVFYLGLTEGIATYDIILRNWNPNQALRFGLHQGKGGTYPKGEIIGDGLVFGTRIGAKGYYRSITREEKISHFALAFNNPCVPMNPVALEDQFSVEVEILRENAILCLDNLPSFWFLRAGDQFQVKKHHQKTRVIDFLEYYCEPCQKELSY